MTKRFWLLLTALLLLALPALTVAQDDADAACVLDAPASATTVDMIGWAFPITEFYAAELTRCDAVENLSVRTQLLDSAGAREQVRLALASGGVSPYEIIHADDGFLLELAAAGHLLALDELIAQYSEQYALDDIPASLYAAATYDGQVYGIPIISNTMFFYYRPDLLEAAGIAVPETYDELIAACAALPIEGDIELPFTLNLHAGWAWRLEFHNFLKAYGGDWLDADSQPIFNGPEGVAAVEKILEVADACMGEEGLTYSLDDTEVGLETGTLAMAHLWASRAANMDNPELSLFVDQIAFAPALRVVEGGPHAGPAATDYYVIPANTDVDAELIFQIIMNAADLESQMRGGTLAIVTRNTVAEGEMAPRYLAAAQTTIANGAGNYGSNPAVALARVAIETHLPRVLSEGLSAQEALDAAAEAYLAEATAQGFIEAQS